MKQERVQTTRERTPSSRQVKQMFSISQNKPFPICLYLLFCFPCRVFSINFIVFFGRANIGTPPYMQFFNLENMVHTDPRSCIGGQLAISETMQEGTDIFLHYMHAANGMQNFDKYTHDCLMTFV